MNTQGTSDVRRQARVTGVLYLLIIVLALFSEVVVRGRMIVPGDPAGTADRIRAAEALFRFGVVSDVLAFVCDVAVAALLYVLLRPVHQTVALVAAGFRLVGTAVYSVNLLNPLSALVALGAGGAGTALEAKQAEGLAYVFLQAHGQGYDLGLVFFGFHCAALGFLVFRAERWPNLLGGLLGLAGVVYVVGSLLLFLAPAQSEQFAPAYAVPLIAELAFSLWLIAKGGGAGTGP